MKEQLSTIYTGLLTHFGPSIYFIFMIWWFGSGGGSGGCSGGGSSGGSQVINITNLFLYSAIPVALAVLYLERKYPIVHLDPVSLCELYQSIIDTFVDGLLIGPGVIFGIRWVFAFWTTCDNIWKTILLFVLIDFSYYLIHRFVYHNHYYKTFYRIHLPHHCIKYLDFLRGSHSSILDNGVVGYQLSCALWSYILNVSINQTLIVYYLILLLQITHHANYTFNIGYLRYIFIDSHCHKLHHCVGGNHCNLGGILSIWDLIFGTFYENHELCANEIHAEKLCVPLGGNKKIQREITFINDIQYNYLLDHPTFGSLLTSQRIFRDDHECLLNYDRVMVDEYIANYVCQREYDKLPAVIKNKISREDYITIIRQSSLRDPRIIAILDTEIIRASCFCCYQCDSKSKRLQIDQEIKEILLQFSLRDYLSSKRYLEELDMFNSVVKSTEDEHKIKNHIVFDDTYCGKVLKKINDIPGLTSAYSDYGYPKGKPFLDLFETPAAIQFINKLCQNSGLVIIIKEIPISCKYRFTFRRVGVMIDPVTVNDEINLSGLFWRCVDKNVEKRVMAL